MDYFTFLFYLHSHLHCEYVKVVSILTDIKSAEHKVYSNDSQLFLDTKKRLIDS